MKRYVILVVMMTASLQAMDEETMAVAAHEKCVAWVDVEAGLTGYESEAKLIGLQLTRAQALDIVLSHYGIASLQSRDALLKRMPAATYQALHDIAIDLQCRTRRSRRIDPRAGAVKLLIEELDKSFVVDHTVLVKHKRKMEEIRQRTELQGKKLEKVEKLYVRTDRVLRLACLALGASVAACVGAIVSCELI